MALMSKDRLLELQREMLERPMVRQLRARVARLEQQVEAYRNLLIGGDDEELDSLLGDPFRPTRKYTRKPGSRPPGRPRAGTTTTVHHTQVAWRLEAFEKERESDPTGCACGGEHKYLPPDPILERAFARRRLTQQVK
jgi:hypothetical protein